MKLAHPQLSFLVPLRENEVNVLSFEAPAMFRKYVRELMEQCSGGNGRFVLSEEDIILKIDKLCVMIPDVLSLDFSDRKLTGALAKWLRAEAVSPRMYMNTQQVQAALLQWIGEIAESSDYPLQYSDEADLAQLFKALNVMFASENSGELERMDAYLKLCGDFLHAECIILVNAKRYFEKDELALLFRSAFYRKMKLILLENGAKRDFPYERLYCVDADGCDLFEDVVE